MSMIGRFVALPPDTFGFLRADPPSLDQYLFPEAGDYPDRVHPECDSLDVGKAWHGIHFLLTATPWGAEPPLGLAVLGGEECGVDTGYGRPRWLEVGQTRAVAAALAAFSLDEAASRCSLDDFDAAEIYPFGWREDTDRMAWLVHSLGTLEAFYRRAAAEGKVVVKSLS